MTLLRPITHLAAAATLAGLAACAAPEVTSGVHDPFETRNRNQHETNKALDRAVLRPAAYAYGETIPEPIRIGVANVAANLSLPGTILNDLLQLNLEDAAHNTVRLLVNSTVGFAGVVDVAGASGVEARPTDFGETLYTWGVGEGAYVELPLLGPSTERDAIGKLVDMMIDPLNGVLSPAERSMRLAFGLGSKIGDRYRFGATVDSLLYESADSYVQSRLFYIESRRFALGDQPAEGDDELYDLYEQAYE